ncbi:MAG: methylated-DNA--[protein]-cysteine S-methyltransferase [Caulobacteraceae bacterium]|nr:methylated-DNA--[protein]-cysteine S-methyltransferase [Caulobacteraceae bacterium]
MHAAAFAIFGTALGPGAIAWNTAGVRGMALPGPDEAAQRAYVARRHPQAEETAPPPPVAEAIGTVQALLETGRGDLGDVPLDLSDCPPLHQRVYEIACAIPPGETLTYGDIARRLGDVALAQQVGQALGRNPIPIIVPCHRILAANGGTGGFSAPGGVDTKLKLLTIERARTTDAPSLFPLDELPLAKASKRL